MNLLKAAAVGALGLLAYRAWKKKRDLAAAASAPALYDAGLTTPPHGDPLFADLEAERDIAMSRMAQSSRGFGDS